MRNEQGLFNVTNDLTHNKNVLMLDNFDGAQNWVVTATGDSVLGLAAAAAWYGATGLQMKTRTTSAANSDFAIANRFIQLPRGVKKLVYRFRIKIVDVSVCRYVYQRFDVFAGGREYVSRIVYAPNTGLISYLDSLIADVTIVNDGGIGMDNQWATMEMSYDLDAMTYLNGTCFGRDFDLGGVPFWDRQAATVDGIQLGIYVYTLGAAPVEIHIDNVFVGGSE